MDARVRSISGSGADVPFNAVEADEQKPFRRLLEVDRTVFDEPVNGADAQAYERRDLFGRAQGHLRLTLFTQDACSQRMTLHIDSHDQRFVGLGGNQGRLFDLHHGDSIRFVIAIALILTTMGAVKSQPTPLSTDVA